eukprot:1157945-Pelagomonas_calceolata.AAC.1
MISFASFLVSHNILYTRVVCPGVLAAPVVVVAAVGCARWHASQIAIQWSIPTNTAHRSKDNRSCQQTWTDNPQLKRNPWCMSMVMRPPTACEHQQQGREQGCSHQQRRC